MFKVLILSAILGISAARSVQPGLHGLVPVSHVPVIGPISHGPISHGPIGPISHGPISHGPISHGPINHGPISHGPISHGHGPVGRSEDVHAEVKLIKSDVRPDGFDTALETSNSISQSASGDVHGNIHGQFSWVSPEGEHIAVQYVADENGYQPTGAVLPTPPPIPEAILRSIAWIEAHPNQEAHIGRPVHH